MILLVAEVAHAQRIKTFELNASLIEISGLELINDSTLIAINDGGNGSYLFVLETNGTIRKKVNVSNVENKDWEDLASDGTFLYIGDIGNNDNQRRDLCVYKIKINDIYLLNEVPAEKIDFSYKEQTLYPPPDDQRNFDAEALVCYKDKLLVFTKTNAYPFTGKSLVYSIPKTPGTYVVKKQNEVFIGDSGWWADAITGADALGDDFYFLTYNRISIMNFAENKFELIETLPFEKMTQMESIVIKDKQTIFVADEKQALLGGGNLYKITLK